ncbi:hypothetical protein D3C84_1067600 [compost metagenome]
MLTRCQQVPAIHRAGHSMPGLLADGRSSRPTFADVQRLSRGDFAKGRIAARNPAAKQESLVAIRFDALKVDQLAVEAQRN